MNELISTGQELLIWLLSLQKIRPDLRHRYISKGCMVSAKVRKEFLCSEFQGTFLFNGVQTSAKFKNMGSGVWMATVNMKDKP